MVFEFILVDGKCEFSPCLGKSIVRAAELTPLIGGAAASLASPIDEAVVTRRIRRGFAGRSSGYAGGSYGE